MTDICSVFECAREVNARGWCLMHYKRWRRHGDPLKVSQMKSGTLEDRVRHIGWSNVSGGCWEWKGSRHSFGHGVLSFQGQRIGAHRAAYSVWVGPIPEGKEIRHKCDNPPCINPAHLEPGTHAENMQDSAVRGRARSSRGEEKHSAILTEQKVLDIRSMALQGQSSKDLSLTYGVSYYTIRDIVTGRRWRHLL